MNVLASISLTSHATFAILCVLSVAALLSGAVFLPRLTPTRHPKRAGRWLGITALLITPALLLTATGAILINRSLGLVKTTGDLAKLIASSVSPSEQVTSGEATTEEQSATSSELDADFTRDDTGMLTATWTGPTSGITQPIHVITPRDYSPTDGKTYGVIELLHGYPGGADGLMQGLNIQQALDEAIDAGIIPPSIAVAPSLNVDEEEHDCADISSRPAVFTWTTREVPAMIHHNFPNTTTKRDAWLLGGFSAGAYCAVWSALRAPDTFGAAAMISGYNTQLEGQMKNQGEQYLEDNKLSTMLATRTPDGMRVYAMAAGDDPVGGASAALAMAEAVKSPDSVTTDIPPTGGHTGPLWVEKVPSMLAWWGSSDSVSNAVGTETTSDAARTSAAYEAITPSATITHEARPTAPNGRLALLVVAAGALFLNVVSWRFARRWRARPLSHAERNDDTSPPTPRSSSRFAGAFVYPLRACAAFAARFTALSLSAVSSAALIGMCANVAGGFYTSWSSVVQSFVDGLR